MMVLPFLMAMANIGGITGGGLTVPLLITFWGFGMKEAIAISGFTSLSVAAVRYVYSRNSRHPEKNTTHIDYGLVIVMVPFVQIGSFIGVFFNLMLPPVVLSIILTILLVFLTIQSLIQGYKIYQQENNRLLNSNLELRELRKNDSLHSYDSQQKSDILANRDQSEFQSGPSVLDQKYKSPLKVSSQISPRKSLSHQASVSCINTEPIEAKTEILQNISIKPDNKSELNSQEINSRE